METINKCKISEISMRINFLILMLNAHKILDICALFIPKRKSFTYQMDSLL